MVDLQKRKVLIRLEDLKMYFPVKKDTIFQRFQLNVKAVDGVSIDIYEGETFGLVGESGCGKTTLGRALLRLNVPSGGSVRYSGITFNEFAPKYMHKDIKKIRAQKNPDVEQLIEKNTNIVMLAGGMLLSNEIDVVKDTLEAKYQCVSQISKQADRQQRIKLNRLSLSENKALSNRDKHKLKSYDRQIESIEKQIAALEMKLTNLNQTLDTLRDKCSGKEGFDQLEALVDFSVDLSRISHEEMRILRKELQIVFQDPYSSLNPRLTVGQLISEALVAHRMYKRSTEQIERHTVGTMAKCGLQHYMLHRYPHQFSGGQRQRIGIARALALNPRFVVCDEAVSALDVSIQSQIINLLMDLKEQNNLTYLFISHDLSTVKFISDRIGVMYLGNIIELASSDRIFLEPLHPYTEALLGAIPTTEEDAHKELQTIVGDIPSAINPPSGCKFHTRCKYAQEKCSHEWPEWRELIPGHFVACHYPLTENRG